MPDLDMQFWMGVHVIKQLLIVLELLIPFQGLSVAKVISQRSQHHLGPEQFGFLPVLVQQHLNPVGGGEEESGHHDTLYQTNIFLAMLEQMLQQVLVVLS